MGHEQDLLNRIDPSLQFDLAYTPNVYRVIQDGTPRVLKFSGESLSGYEEVMKEGIALRLAKNVDLVVDLIKAYFFGERNQRPAILKEYFDGYPLPKRMKRNPELQSRLRTGVSKLNSLNIRGVDLNSPNICVSEDGSQIKIIELGGITLGEYQYRFGASYDFGRLVETGMVGKELAMIELARFAREYTKGGER